MGEAPLVLPRDVSDDALALDDLVELDDDDIIDLR
jgi:hypothetical protein